ncbi:Holliday junction resolvase RecU, partial [Microvirga sp. 3-52]|nr:Holliday junction resolvase RecU [Microvirga sp. 3-52]
PSTTDYNGVWNGHYLDFEAKETKSKTSFPLQNIHEHQMIHMKNVTKQKGIAFVIVKFSTLNRHFVVPYDVIEAKWERMKAGGRKSIALLEFESESIEIELGFMPSIDYLGAISDIVNHEGNIER